MAKAAKKPQTKHADWYCLVVHKNTREHTLAEPRNRLLKKSDFIIFLLLSFFLTQNSWLSHLQNSWLLLTTYICTHIITHTKLDYNTPYISDNSIFIYTRSQIRAALCYSRRAVEWLGIADANRNWAPNKWMSFFVYGLHTGEQYSKWGLTSVV